MASLYDQLRVAFVRCPRHACERAVSLALVAAAPPSSMSYFLRRLILYSILAAALAFGFERLLRVEFSTHDPARSAILVTGASSGIGRAAALALAQKGYLVYAGVRSPTFSSEFSKLNARLRPIVIDVAKPEQIEAAVTALSGEFADQKPWRRVSLVGIVNNAGTTLKRPLETVPLEDVQSLWDVNVMGALRVSQAFAPMLRASKGRIVNVGSVQGCVTLPMWGPYALTKYAVEALSDGLRQELEPFGISVSLVSPGYVNTELRGKGVPSNKSLTTTERDQYYSRFAAMWKKDAELIKLSPPCCAETDAAIVHAMTDPFPRTRYYPFTANVKFGPLFPAWLASMLLRATSVHPLLDRLKDKVIWVTGS